MSGTAALRTILSEVDPSWHGDGPDRIEPELLAAARNSALGRRLLGRWLAAGDAPALLAPQPGEGFGAAALRWPRARVERLVRDLGALAYAPAIRAEVRRDPVRRLKQALDNAYLLALDSLVWDGKVQAQLGAQLNAELDAALRDPDDRTMLDLLDRRGRAELRLWAERRDPGLADWSRLLLPRALHDPSSTLVAHLPPETVERLHSHHGARPLAA
ncbi:hypothetical protein AZ78_2775 [Lysobacter capsici AZ78]|uniref:Uncharacterized protein n=1 Tax=Lysobacter capsici AZ78 TaxID=1444315 RepID=A0A108U9W2_9GAMM|nr:hypothetical protein [Lysobacter capsici]KWS05224.1 hypothetical protein AZ78_2775 [Lysobacter capsici AZ78]